MINLFKKSVKTTEQVIEEIHESFYTEVDRLLESANIGNSLETNKQALIDKREKLVKLGFTSTKEVVEADKEIERLNALRADNAAKKTIIEAINYFSFKYPNYKFITEESVKKICEKYGLIYGAISKYIGTVPSKNITQMEQFKIDENDECYEHYTTSLSTFSGLSRTASKYINKKEYDAEIDRVRELNTYRSIYSSRNIYSKCGLEIAAPIKDFNLEGQEVSDFKISKIEIPDPVVLKPVVFKSNKYYLIVTAWGLEAIDELVFNEKQN